MLELTSTRARTRRLLIENAMKLFDNGSFPSITEVAHEAQLSRATAYRYFPTQSALISAIVTETLQPIKNWQPTMEDVNARIDELLGFAFPRMLEHLGTLRAALHLSLAQWAQAQAINALPVQEKLVRGNRKVMLNQVITPLKAELPPVLLDRVMRSLSLVFGLEIFVVMKDIWGCDNEEVLDIGKWIAKAIIRQAREEALVD